MKYPNRISIIEFVHTMEHNPIVKKEGLQPLYKNMDESRKHNIK